MTDFQLKRRAVQNFRNLKVPKHVRRQYQRQWLRQVSELGPRWVLAPNAHPRSYYE